MNTTAQKLQLWRQWMDRSRVIRLWWSQKKVSLHPVISHKSAFIASLRKVGPAELFMSVGSFQRRLPSSALDSIHAQNVPCSHRVKQCPAQFEAVSWLKWLHRAPPSRESTEPPLRCYLFLVSCCCDKRSQLRELQGERAHVGLSSRS